MTTKQLTKKINQLEEKILELRQELAAEHRTIMETRSVWERTRGVISPQRARSWLRYVKQERQKADRQFFAN